jgi:hypothetical protein
MDEAERMARKERSGGNYGAGTKEMQVGGVGVLEGEKRGGSSGRSGTANSRSSSKCACSLCPHACHRTNLSHVLCWLLCCCCLCAFLSLLPAPRRATMSAARSRSASGGSCLTTR